MPKGGPPAVVDEHGAADFAKLMTVPEADELIDSAFGRARKAQAPKGEPGQAGTNRELARVGEASRAFESQLHRVIRSFPSIDDLHPFYRELVDVLVGADDLKQHLGAVDWARNRVQDLRADAEDRIRDAENNHEAMLVRRETYGRMASVIEDVEEDLVALEEARYELAGVPELRVDAPTLVLAGYPNVGKSSFLEAVSSASPEVASYPFTTKGIALGHREHRHHQVQLMDTPGLLDRPMDERNAIERQAVLALRHAADAVLFVLDPSGHCGYPIEDQRRLLDEVQRLFEDTRVLVVENKNDIKRGEVERSMSCETGDGVDDVAEEALDAAVEAFNERWELF